jgi:membrane fusion protein, hemolysin D
MKSARQVIPFPRPAPREREEIAFLPAALEIVETPPSPIGRTIGLTIIAIFCLALTWAFLGKIDIVASARGQIIPSGRVKVVQPFETGVVRAIHVRDGQRVKAGEVLIELDPTMNQAERNHLRNDFVSAQLDVARLRAALSESANPVGEFKPPAETPVALVAMQRSFLIHQIEEHRANLADLDHQRAKKEAERDTIGATIGKIEAVIPVTKKRLALRKALYDKHLTSELMYLDTLQQLIEEQKEKEVQQSHYREAEAALAAIISTRAQADAEYHRKLSSDLNEAERKVTDLSNDLIKAEQRTKLQELTAPVAGVVQQLAIHTIGGVVTPAQALLVVVPADSHLEIQAMVSNRDIGFVHVGQPVEIKIDTFNFTRYGLLHGQVINVSSDAILRDNPQNKANSANSNEGAENASSEPQGQQLVYAADISLDRTQMQVDGKLVSLEPGMAVTAEIRTGSRSVMSYLLSPLLKFQQDSLRER